MQQSKSIPRPIWRNGVAYVAWFDEKKQRTERVSLRTRDRDEAQARYAAFLVEGADIISSTRRDARISVTSALDDYYHEHVALRCDDKERQEHAIVHLKAFFGSTPVGDVDILMTRSYAAARRAGAIGGGKRTTSKVGSDSTIRRELTVLVAAANHAVRWKRTTLADTLQVEKPTESSPVADWYTKEELATIFGAATGKLLKFCRIAYYTAGRRNSIETLVSPQIDRKLQRINLSKPGEQKTCKRRPIVPLFDEIKGDINALLAENTGGPLFGSTDFYWPFRALCEDVGLVNKSNPHLLRHSRATHLLQDGVDIWTVAKLLGDSVKTVERVYGHACPDFMAATIGART